MEVNADLEMAWKFVSNTSANLFLTGKAGTGKTTFLKELKKKSPKRMIVLAPTGIAAVNAGGVTIHSFFQLPLSPYVPGMSFEGGDNKRYQFSKVKKQIIRTLDLLVIDEISMVRADLLDAVDSVMRRYREHDKPFGGVQMLMIGDLQQLPPVVKDSEWSLLGSYYDTPYFFSSKALALAQYYTIELKTVYRQQDERFLSLLNSIRTNKADNDTLRTLNQRYMPDFKPPYGSDYIQLTTHNKPAREINERELSKLDGCEHTFKAVVDGTFPENSYPAEEYLTLKKGAQVMFIKNDPEKRFFNGMIGEVVAVDDKQILVHGKGGDDVFELQRADWSNTRYEIDNATQEIVESVEGVFSQYPLRLAWAITIHKSQGLTFEHAIIDASHSFAHGQTYVALSRCKSLEGLVLSQPLRPSAIISDGTIDHFNESIPIKTPTNEELGLLEKAFIAHLLDELFDMSGLHGNIEMVFRTLNDHFYRNYQSLIDAYRDMLNDMAELRSTQQKFSVQYRRMIESNCEKELLQERIRKGARYFGERLQSVFETVKRTNPKTDNKLYRQQLYDRLAELKENLDIKRRLLKYEGDDENRFGASDYLKIKARTILNDYIEDTPKKSAAKKKETAKPKEPKIPSQIVSCNMLKKGMTIQQIAKERALAESTIFSHLAQLIVEGKLELGEVVTEENIKTIAAVVEKTGTDESLKTMKEQLPEHITYDEIRLVRNFIAAKTKEKSEKGDGM